MQENGSDTGSRMRLYDRRNQRLYINAQERRWFHAAAHNAAQPYRNFALTLLYSGCRLSEALALTFADVNEHGRLISIRSLKKRNRHEMREVPIPPELAEALAAWRGAQVQLHGEIDLSRSLWLDGDWQPNRRINTAPFATERLVNKRPDRTTGYRWIKELMADAGIVGKQASPKGLRHGYGVHAICCGVQLNMLRKWMGHASLKTTAIYANAVGREELAIADRMWGEQMVGVGLRPGLQDQVAAGMF